MEHLVHHITPRTSCIAFALVCAMASSAVAQDRYAGRSHMELSFAPGWGIAIGEPNARPGCRDLYCAFDWTVPPTDEWLALTADFRIYAPENVGFVLRTGFTWGMIVVEPGAAYEIDLHSGTEGGVRLQLAGGLAIAAPFADAGFYARDALGGWAQAGIDFRTGSFFAGLAVDARAMARPEDGVAYGVITPTLRIGGEWGL